MQVPEPSRGARRVIATTLAALAALAGGCGSDPDELSAEELVAQGNEICVEAREAFTDLQPKPPGTAREAADLTEQLIGIAEDELERIDDLQPSADLEDELDAYLEARETGIEYLHDGLEAAENEDITAYADAQAAIADDQVERLKLARAVGFTECSRPLARTGSSSG
jgi:hypothetical protein